MLPLLHCHSCSHHAIIAVGTTMLSLPHLPCHCPRTVASSPHCCIVAALLRHRSRHTVVVTAVTVIITAVAVHRCCCRHIVVATVAIPFLSQLLCRSHHALMPPSLHRCCRSFHAVTLPQFSCHLHHHTILVAVDCFSGRLLLRLIVAPVDCCSG